MEEKVFEKLYQYQKEAVYSTVDNDKGIICMPTGVGKCLAKGTKILMYDGTFKKVEDITYDLLGELCQKISVDEWIASYEKNFKK